MTEGGRSEESREEREGKTGREEERREERREKEKEEEKKGRREEKEGIKKSTRESPIGCSGGCPPAEKQTHSHLAPAALQNVRFFWELIGHLSSPLPSLSSEMQDRGLLSKPGLPKDRMTGEAVLDCPN